MHNPGRVLLRLPLLAAAAATLTFVSLPISAQEPAEQPRRPRLNLRATPAIGVSPVRVVLSAELVGGADDFEEYYCPTVEWDWGDDTRSESTSDCEPFEAGKSEIRRRYAVEHVFRRGGTYKVFLRLKRRDKAVATAYTTIQVRPGATPFDP